MLKLDEFYIQLGKCTFSCYINYSVLSNQVHDKLCENGFL